MNISLPIIAVAYNRPASLKRLLSSITAAYYPKDIKVPLIISIDYSGSDDCLKVAEETEWTHGPKEIIAHQKNLGLREHILSCGDIALKNDGVIILEDDCFVSKDFYNYALQTFEFYKDEPKVAGISLYSYEYNENAGMPFQPLHDGYDVYFMQVPSSWGQIWTKQHWVNFRAFYDQSPKLNPEIHFLPENVFTWPESSWKKYFYLYIVLNDLYFVYPQVSHSTNFGDVGTHLTYLTHRYQTTLSNARGQKYLFPNFENSVNKYDGFFEANPRMFKEITNIMTTSLEVNIYGTKPHRKISSEHILLGYHHPNSLQSFSTEMRPLVNNIIYRNFGSGLSIVKTKHLQHRKDTYSTELIEKQNPITFQKGYQAGCQEIKQSKTYRLGSIMKHMFGFVLTFRKRTYTHKRDSI
jgi:hypothetical protein